MWNSLIIIAMALKDEIKQENIKIKDMPPKKKAEYIWEYYKFHIIGVIAAIIFICTFVHDWRLNSRPMYIDALLINSDIGYTEDNYIKEDLIKHAGIDTDTYNINVDTSIIISEDSYDQMSVANSQKVMAIFAAGSVDCLIGPDSIMDGYGNVGAFADLEDVLSKDRIKKYEDAGFEVYYATEYEDDGNGKSVPIRTFPAGIYLDASPYFNAPGHEAFKTQEEAGKRPVFAFAVRSERFDNSLKFLNMLTGI